ncbi:MAG: radical SAM protein [Spirochaetes bacterium]|nr:radical SAM protein [Spirochaetota bacterium]MBU1079844.1 radical SAM protein [Spirochaetota bacterium]
MPDHSDFLKRAFARRYPHPDSLYGVHGERDFGNPAWRDAPARFLVARLSPFRDVERSTPHEFLYRELRAAWPDAYIDFAFFPSELDRRVLEGGGVPLMHGVASARGAADFDVVMVSNAYTLELVNLAPYLSGSGVPPTRRARELAPERFPLVVLGGSNAMASAAAYDPDTGDSLVDAVFFGEGEGSAGRLAPGLARAAGLPAGRRLEALEALAREIAGFWPTASRLPVAQAKAPPDAYPVGPPPLIAGEESGTARLEITRGCPSFCSFCFEGWERKPFRERPIESVIAEAERLKAGGGADSIELASYNFNAHSRIVDIIRELGARFWSVSFQSQRVDILARSPGLVRFESAAGKRSFTVGVEGISARARAYYSKELSEPDLRAVLERLVREGAREIKLFYILSGFEDATDLAEFASFASWLGGVVSSRPSPPRVMFSAGELVRMPFTPLAYERLMLDEGAFAAIRARFESAVAAAGFESRSPERFDEYCLSQVLALAPKGSYGLLLALAGRGFVYDRGLSRGAWEYARDYLGSRGALGESFTGEKPADYPFAYGFVVPIASRERVYGRFVDAKERRENPSCLGAACAACGACNDESERSFLAGHELATVSEGDQRAIEAIVSAKRKPYEAFVRARLSPEAARAHPAYAAASFRRALFAAAPALAGVVWTAEDAFLGSKEGLARLPGAWGDTCYRILSSRPLGPHELEAAGYEVLAGPPDPERLYVDIRVEGPGLAEGPGLPEAARLVSDFLAGAAMPFTLRKAEGEARYAVSDKGRKKRNVLEASVAVPASGPDAGRALVSFVCGRKRDLGALAALARKRGLSLDIGVSLEGSGASGRPS